MEVDALVASAERALVRANPARPSGERHIGWESAYAAVGIRRASMSAMRVVHEPLTEADFAAAPESARAEQTPATRRYLREWNARHFPLAAETPPRVREAERRLYQ